MNQSTNQKWVIANWKMFGDLASNQALLEAYLNGLKNLKNTQVVVCAPYPYLAQCQALLAGSQIAWGAQNLAKAAQGAYTGEVSAAMLRDFGCQYVIIGHSERATAYCESDENIAQKFMTAKQHGLTPILCVGETLLEREAGVQMRVVEKQLDTIIRLHGAEAFANTIVSYEPIWAIGTSLAATPAQAEEMHLFIREKIFSLSKTASEQLKIIYGGSVNPQNALQLLSLRIIQGGLVGRCALNATMFNDICFAAEKAASLKGANLGEAF